MPALRLTTAQALVRFLAAQYTERDGERRRLIRGVWGVFGHGNVAGLGQALLGSADGAGDPHLPFHMARNEQAMVHTAAAFAKASDRLSTYACTASTGPGSTNMVTGAALATANRLPVLLLPGDMFATRPADPALQQLEAPHSGDLSVNDALRPVSRYWDRISRPEQLPSAALAAMRVLTDQAETGAVTLCLPQDVQAEAHDWPAELFAERVWHIDRPLPDAAALERAAALLRQARRPLIVAGGGAVYAGAAAEVRAFAEEAGIPVADTHAGKGAVQWDHPCALGGIGATGTAAANALAAEADAVLGIGTRYSDFTTASRTVFAAPDVRFANLNIARFDAVKHSGTALVGDAREGLRALRTLLSGYRAAPEWQRRAADAAAAWHTAADAVRADRTGGTGPLTQGAVLGVLNDALDDRDVVVNAAGSLPGDLQRLWRARDPKGYHVEYAYSCMGYEIAAGLGVRLAAPDRTVAVLVGDGSYLMLAQEITTMAAEGVPVLIVVLDNGGFASIGGLSEQVGSERFGTELRHRDPGTGRFDGAPVPIDLAANAASLGARAVRAATAGELRAAVQEGRTADTVTVVHVATSLTDPQPPTSAWWDVPVAETAESAAVRAARTAYDKEKARQRPYL